MSRLTLMAAAHKHPESPPVPDETSGSVALRLVGISMNYGGRKVLHSVSLGVPPGQVCALIGPNGSGKSTLLNIASRLIEPTAGSVECLGVDVTSWTPHRLARLGVRSTFQRMRFAEDLTALQNVAASIYCDRRRRRIVEARFRWPWAVRKAVQIACAAQLERLNAGEFASWRVAALSHGTRRKVDLARALVAEPRLLLLDEPASGVSMADVGRTKEAIMQVAAAGCAVLLVEHDLGFVSDCCDRVVVLDAGAVIFDGSPEGAMEDPAVVAAYLGGGDAVSD